MIITDNDDVLSSTYDPAELLSPKQAASLIKFSDRALEAWRQRGGGPPFVRVSSRAIRYRRKDLITWAAERVHSNTGQG